MLNPSFDNHATIKSLIKTGMKEDQAEIIVKAIATNNNAALNNLVTKDYLDVRLGKLEVKISELESKLLYWFIGTTLTLAGLMIALRMLA